MAAWCSSCSLARGDIPAVSTRLRLRGGHWLAWRGDVLRPLYASAALVSGVVL